MNVMILECPCCNRCIEFDAEKNAKEQEWLKQRKAFIESIDGDDWGTDAVEGIIRWSLRRSGLTCNESGHTGSHPLVTKYGWTKIRPVNRDLRIAVEFPCYPGCDSQADPGFGNELGSAIGFGLRFIEMRYLNTIAIAWFKVVL